MALEADVQQQTHQLHPYLLGAQSAFNVPMTKEKCHHTLSPSPRAYMQQMTTVTIACDTTKLGKQCANAAQSNAKQYEHECTLHGMLTQSQG